MKALRCMSVISRLRHARRTWGIVTPYLWFACSPFVGGVRPAGKKITLLTQETAFCEVALPVLLDGRWPCRTAQPGVRRCQHCWGRSCWPLQTHRLSQTCMDGRQPWRQAPTLERNLLASSKTFLAIPSDHTAYACEQTQTQKGCHRTRYQYCS